MTAECLAEVTASVGLTLLRNLVNWYFCSIDVGVTKKCGFHAWCNDYMYEMALKRHAHLCFPMLWIYGYSSQ